jgi:hypothetical protein
LLIQKNPALLALCGVFNGKSALTSIIPTLNSLRDYAISMNDNLASTSYKQLEIYKSYKESKYLSIKHSSYFQVYEDILSKYRDKEITFVEVGVLNGGSLFMWRDYFGPKARIIGIDFNPLAKKWVDSGFEIFIGNQADPEFWKEFFTKTGSVDIVLDDGGHTNEQQIVTTIQTIPNINNGGVLIVEDVHASYTRQFANPSKYSFINYARYLIDSINSRFPQVSASQNTLRNYIYSLTFFESIVCFQIDRTRCYTCSPTSNEGQSSDAQDYRQHSERSRGLGARIRHLSLRKYFCS